MLGVGRGEENAIRLECPSVSRMHLELHPVRDGLEVEDLGSSNGTTLIRGSAEAGSNGQEQLTPHERFTMKIGDALRVGSALISLQTKRRSILPTSGSSGVS